MKKTIPSPLTTSITITIEQKRIKKTTITTNK